MLYGCKGTVPGKNKQIDVTPGYLVLASNGESSYICGKVLHPDGGEIING